ncbi:pyruvate carboxylase subunit B [Clostridiales bacterium 1_7_47FAA]|uniref:Pyruvate carboxylase subunit B n=1 Tax=Enterocloster hominis (ex Hitch et al. 2024) TaxID=1917870 RepID=A0ABV1D838_9FIRM|nr:pyruvate carboxylase subunit B [Clostridiales bacterium 1_7_47FAA]
MFWKKKGSFPSGHSASDFAGTGSPVRFNSVEFRDGQQSLFATRMTTADMVPLLSAMDQVGYDSMEMWGGATFDVAVRFLKEDPWDRIREFKKYVKRTPLKMVLRGQNLVGYKAYPDDVVEKFVEKAAAAGIDVFLIFDALQDLRNCESAFRAVKKAGKKIEGSIQYNISPFHTIEKFVENGKEQEKMGVSLLHVEDMAGLMTPAAAYDLIKALKAELKVPIHLHCHCTGGMAEMAYWEAIRAGVDGLDVCVSSMSMGPAHPPIESFVTALKGTSRDPHIDVAQFKAINEGFLALRRKYAQFETKLIGVDVGCLEHQIPGGMLSNLESQLTAMKLYDRLPQVLEEVTRVRADMGYPPLATPSSQMCGAQATTNVLTGKRYMMVSNEIKDYCRGMYGMPPGPVSPELLEAALGSEKPGTQKPADMLAPGYEAAKAEAGPLARTEEDVLTYALFPAYAPDFLRSKYNL